MMLSTHHSWTCACEKSYMLARISHAQLSPGRPVRASGGTLQTVPLSVGAWCQRTNHSGCSTMAVCTISA